MLRVIALDGGKLALPAKTGAASLPAARGLRRYKDKDAAAAWIAADVRLLQYAIRR